MQFKPSKEFEGFFRCSPIPSTNDLQKYYEEEFYQSEKPGFINDSSKQVRDSDSSFYNLQYAIFCSILGVGSSNLHVDLGCGYGHFLEYIKTQFPQVKLRGCEVYPEAAKYVEQLPSASFKRIDLNTLSNLKECVEGASSISIINTLEHLLDPIYFLSECRKVMGSESKLLIQVPNDFNVIQKAAVEQLGIDEWWFCPPRHVSYFSPAGLATSVENAGLKVLDIITTFPIDMYLISGIDYRSNPKLGREAHKMRTTFESNFVASNGLDSLIDLYRNFSRAGIGREIVLLAGIN